VKQVTDRTGTRATESQRGVAAVELAIVLPLFGILLLGILEIGGMARDHQALQNAAREGARFSALPSNRMAGRTTADRTTIQTSIQNRVVAYLQNEKITITAADVTVSQSYSIPVGAATAGGSEITVSYDRPVLFPGIARWLTFISSTTTLQGKAIFRNLY
jgi:Flp pilus assembly protein TadG